MTDDPLTSVEGPAGAPAPRPTRELPDLDGHTVLVTGANGFVGARTCTTLVRAGATVRAQVRRAGTAPAVDGVEEVVHDLRGELAPLLVGVDEVVHTVAIAGDDLDAAREVNVGGTSQVLAAAAAAGVARVVHVSTTSVMAEAALMDEHAPLVDDEASVYAVTKRDAEQAVAAASGIDTVVLRPPCVYGWAPTSTWGQRIPELVGAGELPMEVDERAPVGWIHVDDFAAACAQACVDPAAVGNTYVVAAGTSTWGRYLGEVASWFPEAPSPFTPAETPPATRTWSSARIEQDLGWTPSVNLDDALAEMATHHR